jgi:hypothetical protein
MSKKEKFTINGKTVNVDQNNWYYAMGSLAVDNKVSKTAALARIKEWGLRSNSPLTAGQYARSYTT